MVSVVVVSRVTRGLASVTSVNLDTRHPCVTQVRHCYVRDASTTLYVCDKYGIVRVWQVRQCTCMTQVRHCYVCDESTTLYVCDKYINVRV